VVGTFHYGPRQNYGVPIDERITEDIYIPHGMELPAEPAGPTRHRVLGEEARKRLQADWSNLHPTTPKPGVVGTLEGAVVDVEITEWPGPAQNPRGRVVEILGYEDDFGVDVEIIIRKYHLPHRFPPEVLEEAQAVPSRITAGELAHRLDFRRFPIVTIDGETARDFDDAVHVERLANGNWQLQVHIADVSHYVLPGSALDEEARLRGTSVYFPDRAVPMLPLELSTDVCSLRPKLDRLVLSCLMEIDNQGEIIGYELSEGVIRSVERMTYTDVNALLENENDDTLRRRYAPLAPGFEQMRDLALLLNRKRERRGAIDFDLPEPEIEFDEFGLMKSVTRSERNLAHRLIEEFMLAANESVAGYLEAKGVPSLYRIHEKPAPNRVLEFEQLAAAFGYSLGVGAIPVKRFPYTDDRRPRRHEGRSDHSGQRRREIEIPEDIHITPRMYQKLANKIAGTPEERILSYLMLRSLKQARYSEENAGRFALAAPSYTHFTSPIRRYPDLIVHRILKQVLREYPEEVVEAEAKTGVAGGRAVPIGRGAPAGSGTPSPWPKRGTQPAPDPGRKLSHPGKPGVSLPGGAGQGSAPQGPAEAPVPLPELHDIAGESSEAERRADDAERELMEWKKARFMASHIGDDFDGLIVSITKYGFFVELADMFVEGLVPLSSLAGDHYTYHDATRQIIGQRTRKTYSMGDRVRVLVDRIDPVQHKIQFAVVAPTPASQNRSSTPAPPSWEPRPEMAKRPPRRPAKGQAP